MNVKLKCEFSTIDYIVIKSSESFFVQDYIEIKNGEFLKCEEYNPNSKEIQNIKVIVKDEFGQKKQLNFKIKFIKVLEIIHDNKIDTIKKKEKVGTT